MTARINGVLRGLGIVVVAIAGCGGAMDMSTPGVGPANVTPGGNGVGATTGGAQDFRQVRQLIERGQVPHPDEILVEGLLSEHDFPLEGPPCSEVLCLNLATGSPPTADLKKRNILVQVGFLSGLQLDGFRRPPLNLALVVDVSGSMKVGAKMEATRDALTRLTEKLDEGDLVTLIAFNETAQLVMRPTSGDQKSLIRGAIERLYVGGSTNMEAGLQMAVDQLLVSDESEERSSRIMLFTDAQPNVGTTTHGSFAGIMRSAASQGIGLTAFGVGIDFNSQLIDVIANLRSGNYFFLANADAIRSVFDQDFDFMVTPLAHDLKLELTLQPGFELKAAHGVKQWAKGSKTSTVTIPTVFASRNKGAMVVELMWDKGAAPTSTERLRSVLRGNLSFESADSRQVETTVTADVAATALEQEGAYYSQPSVRKVTSLVAMVTGMTEACRLYHAGNHTTARDLVEQLETMLAASEAALGSSAFPRERALLKKLLTNME